MNLPAPAFSAASAPEHAVPTLADCDREPIHVPGTIQPHGALIAFDAASGTIARASANLGLWLPVAGLPAHGRTVTDLLGAEGYAVLQRTLVGSNGGAVRHEVVDLPTRPEQGQPLALQALLHQHRGVCIAEFEPLPSGTQPHDWMQSLADTVDALRAATSLPELVQRAAQRVKRLTGFDRAMVYRFDADWHGHVIADAHEPGMESFLDLHYPASDIPAQARELYANSLVRYLADVDGKPEPVLPWRDSARMQPLDMSHTMLRAMSPIHLQYLRNMGVRSTLTLSILVDGRLWGLIACHHRQPTRVPLRLRRACHALAVTAGYMVGWTVERQHAAETADAARLQARIVDHFNQVAIPLPEVVEYSADALLRIARASGGAFWRDGTVATFGQWPHGERGDSILRHVRHAFETSNASLVDTERAPLQPPLQPAELRQVAGLMALRLDAHSASGIVWLRPEARREVSWGGDPDKPAQFEIDASGQPRLSPRTSFARWEVAVRGRCRPWTEADRAAVRSLAVLRQALSVRDSLSQVSLSDRQFRSLVALQSDAYWQLDAEGRLITLSRTLPSGHGPVQGRALADVFQGSCEPEDVAALTAALRAAVPFSRLPMRGRSPEGLAFELRLSGEPRRDADGGLIGWHGTACDISNEARVQDALRDKLAAEDASRAKSRFLSQISHEVRTPLNAVLGFSQLLLADNTLTPAQHGQVEHILRAGDWLLTMVTDLLDLTALESGRLKLHMAATDARRLMADALQLLRRQAADAGVTLEIDGGEAPVWVWADPTRLSQVLVNLVSNAVKYNRRGGSVRVGAQATPKGPVRIEVRDTGDGLSAEQVESLFTPFNRLGREGQRIQGTGIGLVISKQLLEAMGGHITVQSVPGQGSCFAIVLDAAEPPATAESGAPPADLAPLVLCLHRDPTDALLLRGIVESVPGLRFAHPTTLEAAVATARTQRPVLVLAEADAGGAPDPALLKALRQEPALRGTPCLAVTSDASDEQVRRLLDAGFADCLRKPIAVAALRSRLAALVAPAAPVA